MGIHYVVWGQYSVLQTLNLLCNFFLFPQRPLGRAFIYESDSPSEFAQPYICIVFPEQQPMLSTRSKHPVGLSSYSFCDQIVYENADIGLISGKNQGVIALNLHCSVNPGHYSLCRSLLIARCPVNLTGEVEARYQLGFQSLCELGRVGVVIFNGIAGAHDLCVL